MQINLFAAILYIFGVCDRARWCVDAQRIRRESEIKPPKKCHYDNYRYYADKNEEPNLYNRKKETFPLIFLSSSEVLFSNISI